jgi:hypothetical protein
MKRAKKLPLLISWPLLMFSAHAHPQTAPAAAPTRGNSGQNVVDLTNGAGNSSIQVKVRQGYFLQVHVNDPQAVLPQASSGIGAPAWLFTANGKAQSLRLLGAANGGQGHFIIVPYETPLSLRVSSPTRALSDGQNVRIAGDSTVIPILVPQGNSIPAVVINVGTK